MSQLLITNEIKVELFSHTEPNLPGRAARACYATGDDNGNDIMLTGALLKKKHMEPLENSHFYFECYLPKFVANQLNRHRVGIGRCQQSMRLSRGSTTFYWPDDVKLEEADMEIMGAAVSMVKRLREKKASKRQREILQRLIPENVMIEYRTWMNARELLEIAKKRVHHEAQYECQIVVSMMCEVVGKTEWAFLFDSDVSRD